MFWMLATPACAERKIALRSVTSRSMCHEGESAARGSAVVPK